MAYYGSYKSSDRHAKEVGAGLYINSVICLVIVQLIESVEADNGYQHIRQGSHWLVNSNSKWVNGGLFHSWGKICL